MHHNLEAKARIKINKLLEDAGWRFFDDENGPANILLENHVKYEDLGDDFQQAKSEKIEPNHIIGYYFEKGTETESEKLKLSVKK
jgi:hypothetical protein